MIMDKLKQLAVLATKADLETFLMKRAEKDEGFRKDLLRYLQHKFMNNDDTVEEYLERMKQAFSLTNDIGDRWHSFEVTDWSAINDEGTRIIEEVKELLEMGNSDIAVKVAVSVFTNMEEVLDIDEMGEYDDQDIQLLCDAAEDLLLRSINSEHITEKAKREVLAELIRISKTSLPHDLSNYWLFDFDEMLTQAMASTQSLDDVLTLIDQQIAQHAHDFSLSNYVLRKVNLLRQAGREPEAVAEERKYLHLTEVATAVGQRLFDAGKYDDAIAFALEMINRSESGDQAFRVTDWKHYLVKVYEAKGDTDNLIRLSRELFVQLHGSKDYYLKLKGLVPANEWKDFLSKLLAETDVQQNYWSGENLLADIYVEENEPEKLYQFIISDEKKPLDMLDKYACHVEDNHAQELLDRYETLLMERAKITHPREYDRIAQAMRCMHRIKGGKEATRRLAAYFRLNYKRRPNMMAAISEF